MRIYWIKAQAPRRVLALVRYLGIEAEYTEVDLVAGGLNAPDYVALNPNKKAPTLVDGDIVLWEASAIMAYLCIKQSSDMWPAHNPPNRSRCFAGRPGMIATGRRQSHPSILSTSSSPHLASCRPIVRF
jgi:glutathione S-transferase